MSFKKSIHLNPKKLLLSKWTAVHPANKEKHFLVTKVIVPELPTQAIQDVEIEAVINHRSRIIPWRELTNPEQWQQGWI